MADEWEDGPAASRLSGHGLILEEVKDDIRSALGKWLSKADPAQLHHYSSHREGQSLEKVDVEIRPSDRHGRKRHDKVRLKLSLLVTKEPEGQLLVTVPKLIEPALSFYCYAKDELRETAARELAAYFSETSLEELLAYEHQRQEFLDEIEVSFTPLKPQREKKASDEDEAHEYWALRGSGVNLTARAREDKLRRAYRRDREVGEILSILAAERGNCVLLVGPPGVGKTALVHEAVRRIREDNCPAPLHGRQVWYTSPNQLIAGCSYIGEWQDKLRNLVEEVKNRRHILHVDDVTGLMEAGRWSKGDENMAQFLKPFIEDGTLTLLAECLPERYRVGENLDPGFLGLFRVLQVPETDEQATLGILMSVAAGLERRLRVRIEPAATETAVQLTRRFQPYRAFPGKAISFIERAAADSPGQEHAAPVVIARQQATAAFARHTGLPEFILADHLALDPAAVERHFSERLIGQPDAVAAVVDLVTVIKAGLNDPNKPLGCFFFIGPTGVGKTEMAKLLAEYLFGSRDRIIRFDMSEYAEPLNVAKLIGSPIGDKEGELTQRARLQPFSVVLLDEFEKAHPSIFDVMLQVLGEGRLTDAGGRTADFRSAIIVMTSNLGASPREQRRTGLRTQDASRAAEAHYHAQVEGFFRPEFVNRLDRVVVFRSLDRESMRRIATREVSNLLAREGITRRNLMVEVDDDVLDLLLEAGFSPAYGARPLKRAIEQRVIVPLARYLVSHPAGAAQLVRVRREEDAVQLVPVTMEEARSAVKHGSGPLSTQPDGARKMELKELVDAFAAIRLRLHEWSEGDTVREIRNEWKKLLARTRRRDFASRGQEAAKVWARIYQLERLTRRLDQLRDRAEYLEEFAALAQRDRSHTYQTDLAESYSELRRDSDYLEIELLCAHLKEQGQTLMHLQAVGRAARQDGEEPWLLALAGMYLRWVKRKGYEFRVFAPVEAYRKWAESQGLSPALAIPGFEKGPPPRPAWVEVKVGDFPGLVKRLAALDPPQLAVSAKGANVHGFLKGEAGCHKLLLRGEDSDPTAPFRTAAVRVEALDAEACPLEHLNREPEEEPKAGRLPAAVKPKAEAKKAEDVPPVIRVYCPDGERSVRDLRTGVRTTRVKEVLEGDLDEFVLAALRSEEAAAAWEGSHA